MTDFYAFKRYTGDSTTRDFTVPFDYLEKNHVIPRVNGVEMSSPSYSWTSDYNIRFNNAPAEGAYVDLRRNTPKDGREVVYQNASTLNARQMNTLSRQLLYISQELHDDMRGALHGENPGDLGGYIPDDTTENDVVAEIAAKLTESTLYNEFETQKEDFEQTATTILNNQTIIEDLQGTVTEVDGLAADNAEILIENALRTNDGIEESRGQAQRIEEVEASTGDANTTITENAEAIAGIEGKYTVKVDVNGRVTGYGLIQKENDTGDLVGTYDILADKFTVTDPDTLDVKIGWDGTQFVVDGNLIVGGSLTADQMNITSLSAITANLGTVNAGLFKTADSGQRIEMEASDALPFWYGSGSKTKGNSKFYLDDSGEAFFGGSISVGEGVDGTTGLSIQDDAIEVRDESGAVRVRLGRLS